MSGSAQFLLRNLVFFCFVSFLLSSGSASSDVHSLAWDHPTNMNITGFVARMGSTPGADERAVFFCIEGATNRPVVEAACSTVVADPSGEYRADTEVGTPPVYVRIHALNLDYESGPSDYERPFTIPEPPRQKLMWSAGSALLALAMFARRREV